MRILSISNCPLVRTQGSGYVICGYADGLRARGHEVHLIGPETYVPFVGLRSGWRLRKLLGYTLHTLREVRSFKPDVVELWGAESWLAAKRLHGRKRRPLLVHRSNGLETHATECLGRAAALPAAEGDVAATSRTVSEPAPRGALGRWFDARQDITAAFRRVDALTTVGRFDERYALQHGYQNAEHILALDNPLDDEWLSKSWSPDRHPVVGYVGTWIPRKAVDVVKRAFADVLSRRKDARLLLVGVGDDFKRDREFPGFEEKRINVVPHASRADLPSLYGYMNVLAMPSWYESFGLVCAEAMACGTPVVATATGFAASWTSGDEGWVIPFGDAAALSKAILYALSERDMRAEVAQRAWRRAQALRWPTSLETLEVAYARWIHERGAAVA